MAAERISSPEDCVEATLQLVGKQIVLGLPVAIGKPVGLVNAFLARAMADSSVHLTIVTALSLRKPRARGELERRLLEPITSRVFDDHCELDYIRLMECGRLPANIEIIEYYVEPGAWLRNDYTQQHHLSSNATHVARDALRRGLNVIAQLVAIPPEDEAPAGVLSLGSNTDLTADLLPRIAAKRAGKQPFALIGQIHRELPFMYGDALIAADTFDLLLEATDTRLSCPLNQPIPPLEHAVALNVSALVRDGGTLQLGAGTLADGIVQALQLRHQQPAIYRDLLESTGLLSRHRRLIETEGGTAPFDHGLYGCTEALSDGFLELYRSGILKRRVFPNAKLQRLIDDGHIDEHVGVHTLDAMHAAGMRRMSFADFNELRDVGLFHEKVEYDQGILVAPDGTRIQANFDSALQRRHIAQTCLGERLRNGVLLDSSFLLGSNSFCARLRQLPAEQRRLFAMRATSFINELHGHEWELKLAQRRHARFINTTMMLTGLGGAVSDALEDGRIVSGVGGQYNFVAMAHALPEARAILCLRSTRMVQGKTISNIRWSYGHATIPRHLRDLVVTEYGIADLRGKTDHEIVAALVAVMDVRFQDAFVGAAKRAGKLPIHWRIPDTARANDPQRLARSFAPWFAQGLFSELPFGSDFSAQEIILAKALRLLRGGAASRREYLGRWTRALLSPIRPALRPYLKRMSLEQPRSLRERAQRRLLVRALEDVLAQIQYGRPIS